MANSEKSRAAARKALEAYRAQPDFGTDTDENAFADLIADLAFLADEMIGPDAGAAAIVTAEDYYFDETNPE